MERRELRVLLIEDDEEDYLLTRDLLGESLAHRFVVTWAASYEAGIVALGDYVYDVCLVDYRLGAESGLVLIQQMCEGDCQMPMILLTGQDDQSIDLRALQEGAADYLVKGQINGPLLERSIRYAIERKQAEIERSQRLEAQAAQQRLSLLAQASAVLANSLDYTTTLEHIAQVLVPEMADMYILHLLEDGEYRQIAAAHRDPTKHGLLDMIKDYYRLNLNNHASPVTQALQRREPVWVADTSDKPPEDYIHDADIRRIYTELELGSYLILPLVVRGDVLGTLSLGLTQGQRHYDALDLALAEDLAQRIALAVDNAQLLRATKEAVREREALLSLASHELRNPLAGLLGHAQLLERRSLHDNLLSERDLRSVQLIVQQAVRLNSLLTQLLDMSRLEAGNIILNREPVDLHTLVETVLTDLEPTLVSHHIVVEDADEVLLIDGDVGLLSQVFHNIIGNAQKYSPAGSIITLRLGRHDSFGEVAVRDQGIGIPAGAQAQLFQRFYRVANAQASGVKGFGIGLYVVREIVALHSGNVSVISSEGAGSTFTVALPLADQVT